MKGAAVFVAVALLAALSADSLVIQSGSNCTASARSGFLDRARNTTTRAFANVFIDACRAPTADSLMATSLRQMSGVAQAITEIRLQSTASCSAQGYVLACAQASASGNGTARAAALVVSKAVASAYGNCAACDPGARVQTAKMFSQLVLRLTTQASAVTRAAVCVGPNSTASSSAFANCTAQIYAHGLAYALGRVMIQKGCTNITAEAEATVDGLVSADPMCGCSGYVYTCGANGSSCGVEKTQTDLTVALGGLDSFPAVRASLTSECMAYNTSLP